MYPNLVSHTEVVFKTFAKVYRTTKISKQSYICVEENCICTTFIKKKKQHQNYENGNKMDKSWVCVNLIPDKLFSTLTILTFTQRN